MNDKRRMALLEQYEDAALSLLMDKYAEEEGEQLLQEFSAAAQNGDVPEIPAELDKQCQKLICTTFARRKRISYMKSLYRSTVKTAMFLLILLGISTVTVLSVDALRVPVLNFLMAANEKHGTVLFSGDVDNAAKDSTVIEILDAHKPLGYVSVIYKDDQDGFILAGYQNENGEILMLEITPSIGQMFLDTEDAASTSLNLCGYDAVLIEKDGYHIMWVDDKNEQVYTLYANGLDIDTFLALASKLAE
jgi:hypothetical protein